MTEPNTTSDRDGAMRRLKKLLALAMDPAAAPGEAANAMRMAQSLMTKHNVTEGAIAASEIDEFSYQSTKAATPPPWENALLWVIGKAFGCRHYWTGGRGPKGAREKGYWKIVGEKHKLELIQYAFDVVRRQMINARAKFVATLPEWQTRPVKAAQGDAFGLAFVKALEEKIVVFAQNDPLIAKAIDEHIKRICTGKPLKNAAVRWTSDAEAAGRAAGATASLHRPMSGAAEHLKLGA